jgi:4-amino-4-deoxy-L-arabinose transferase-like glycosyltransferase
VAGPRSIIAVVLAYSALLWWPTRELPYHWDSAGFVAFAAEDLLARGFSPFVLHFTPFAHPPLFVAALALSWKWFGFGLPVGHWLLLPFLPLLLLSTYGVGLRLYNHRVGVAATALTATVPVVVAEYGQVYFDLPLAALLTFALWLWCTDRRILAGLVLGVGVGIKLPAIVFPSVLLLVSAVQARGASAPNPLRRAWALLVPFVVLATWLIYHHSVKGFWLRRAIPGAHTPQGIGELLRNARLIGTYLLAQNRWLIAALGLVSALVHVTRRRRAQHALRIDPGTATLAGLVAVGIAFFSAADVFAQRYGILLLPEIFLLSIAALDAALPVERIAYWGVIALGCGLQFQGWLPPQEPTSRIEARPDEDLHYLDMIELGLKTAAYMQREHPGAHVFGSWPEAYWLTDPHLGYVDRPFMVSNCKDYRPDAPGETVIITHLYALDEPRCWELTRTSGALPVKKLTSGAKWLQIYVAK